MVAESDTKPSTTEEISDDEVIARAVEGDPEAFSVLYKRYVHRIYNYIYYRTGNALDAEDLTERVFFRAMGHIKSYKDMGVPFSAWLYRIAHNLVANWHRDNSRRKEVPLEEHGKSNTEHDFPEATLVQNQEKDSLLRVINKLPPERQQLIILKFVEHLSNLEIAVIMRRSEGAIKSLYHRTLLSLREKLEKSKEKEQV
jgi:RNA polymerase sigma-70 factor, ECF subfamily